MIKNSNSYSENSSNFDENTDYNVYEIVKFDTSYPLINQTVLKIHKHTPDEAQTGPAKRKDMNIIDKHIKSISNTNIKNIYKLLSKSIIESNNSND